MLKDQGIDAYLTVRALGGYDQGGDHQNIDIFYKL